MAKYSSSTEQIDVSYVAHLARLRLSDEEIKRYQEQLGKVIDYVNLLEEVDVEGVAPMSHPVPVNNVFREDKPRPGLDRDQAMDNGTASIS